MLRGDLQSNLNLQRSRNKKYQEKETRGRRSLGGEMSGWKNNREGEGANFSGAAICVQDSFLWAPAYLKAYPPRCGLGARQQFFLAVGISLCFQQPRALQVLFHSLNWHHFPGSGLVVLSSGHLPVSSTAPGARLCPVWERELNGRELTCRLGSNTEEFLGAQLVKKTWATVTATTPIRRTSPFQPCWEEVLRLVLLFS